MLTTTLSTVSNTSIAHFHSVPRNARLYSLSNSKFPGNLQFLRISTTSLELHTKKRCMAIYAGVDPGPLVPPDPSSVPWKWWIAGMLLSAVLPFWRNKFWPLIKLKERVESMVETAEELTDAIEKVAEEVEKIADEAGDHLPEGSNLQKAAIFVEDVAKQTAHDAHLVSQIIDQVEEVEKKVESLIESAMDDDANDITKETKDQPN